MRKIYITIIISFLSICSYAQDSIEKVPIYVLPKAMAADGRPNMDMSTFDRMITNTKTLVSKYPKSYLVDNIQDAKYVIGLFIDIYAHDNSQKGIDRVQNKIITHYTTKLAYTLAISPIEHPDKIIKKVGPYSGSSSSINNYEEADNSAINLEPVGGRIRELLEDALSLDGEIIKITSTGKHNDKADRAWVNLGKKNGILDTQWFDVFILDNNGNKSEKPIGTLHAATVNDNDTECAVKKGDKEIMKAYNQGKKLIVESREEKNLWKKAGRIKDKIRVYL